ncbi:hypothetical protein Nmel_009005 [Mimus melanotis]
MLLARAEERRILNSMSWQSCCHCLQPLPASLIRHPSSDLQLAI